MGSMGPDAPFSSVVAAGAVNAVVEERLLDYRIGCIVGREFYP